MSAMFHVGHDDERHGLGCGGGLMGGGWCLGYVAEKGGDGRGRWAVPHWPRCRQVLLLSGMGELRAVWAGAAAGECIRLASRLHRGERLELVAKALMGDGASATWPA